MAQRVYVAIERLGTADSEDIAALLRTSDLDTVERAIGTLVDLGAIRPSRSQPRAYRAQSPESALARVLETSVSRLRDQVVSISAAADLAADLRRSHVQDDHRGDEHLVGLDAIVGRLSELTHASRSGIDSLLPIAPDQSSLDASLEDDLPMLQRGVRLRSLLPDAARTLPHIEAYAERVQRVGAQVRTTQTVPVRVVIYDRTVAVVTASLDSDTPTAVVVRTGGVVRALSAMFALLWDRGADLLDSTERHPSAIEYSVLNALTQGIKDDAIGRALGVSTRTVRRTISGLCTRTGADSRFALGAEAARRGWLSAL